MNILGNGIVITKLDVQSRIEEAEEIADDLDVKLFSGQQSSSRIQDTAFTLRLPIISRTDSQ